MKFTDSLKKYDEFRAVYNKKRSYANKYFIMYVSENGREDSDQLVKNRLGISVSKKVGNSVVRHTVTRLVRESYRLNEDNFSSGLDIVVVARNAAAGIRFAEAQSAILHLSKLHKILK